jgi:hypothetical protein
MRTKALGALTVLSLLLAACGGGEAEDTGDGDEPLLQIVSEGGFAPVEMVLGNGPRYTLLGDGSLIHQGFQTLEYPGALLPPYLVAHLNQSQMDSIIAMVERMGLPEITEETDDSAAATIADATTDVITYWDENGTHRYSVYALGIQEQPSQRNAVFAELVATFDQFVGVTDSVTYEPARVRVIVLADAFVDPEFSDVRDWPLDDEWGEWQELANGSSCRSFGPETLDTFEDATQATTWEIPDVSGYTAPVKLLIRPLHPGEPDCPGT